MNGPSHVCAKCGVRFGSQNPAIVDGKPVCWNCAPETISGAYKTQTGEADYFDVVRLWLSSFTPEQLKTLRAIINGMLSKRKITPEQQAKMQQARKKKDI